MDYGPSGRAGRARCASPAAAARAGCRRRELLSALVVDIPAHITGVVWKIECAVGDQVAEGDIVVVLESMKMEMPVEAEDTGTVTEVRCEEGQAVHEGDTLVVLG
jgi:acetyl-CoA carboxylase biotin carboxyl carrier protein